MFKNILHIYWMKISTIPNLINNIFYFGITIKPMQFIMNIITILMMTLNILIIYPISVLTNLFILLYYKIKNKRKARKIGACMEVYYENINSQMFDSNEKLFKMLD